MELKDKCRATVRPFVLDLLHRESFDEYASLLEELKPTIAVLVNAAGFGYFGRFMDYSLEHQLDCTLFERTNKGVRLTVSSPMKPIDRLSCRFG